jgi:hypothetical protein
MFKPNEPHGHIQGDGAAGARYYQEGHYYDPHHRYLFSNPGIAAPPGEKLRSMDQAEADYQARQSRQAASTPAAAMGAPVNHQPEPSAPPPPPADPTLTREQQFMQHPVPKLQQFMLVALQTMNQEKPAAEQQDLAQLKKQVIGGPGAKAKLIAWLLANTSA